MTFIELFAGIGGFRYGLESINRNKNRKSQENPQGNAEKGQGLESQERERIETKKGQPDESPNSNSNSRTFNCIWSNEIDKYACKIYRKNFGKGELIEGDIRTINTDTIPGHDLLTAGFPCQAFSIAGKRKGFDDTRGTLFFEIGRVLQHKKPGYFILENVKGLLSHDDGRTFEIIITSLNELGYDVQWQVLNSKNYGVPQNRERVFIIGHLRGTRRPGVFPFRESSQISIRENETKWLSEGQGITYCLDANYYKGSAQQARTMIKHRVHNLQKRSPDRPSLTRLCDCGSGKLYKKCCGVDGGSGHLSRNDGLTYCLDSGSQGIELDKDFKIRRLTPIECERLQGFPDNWTEGVSDTQRYKMLGNAVTTNVITEIGKRLAQEVLDFNGVSND